MKRYFLMCYNILACPVSQSSAGEVVVPRTGKVRYNELLLTMSRPLSKKSIAQAFTGAELAVVDDQYLLPVIPTNPFSGRTSHDADPALPRLTRLSSSRMFGSRQSELYPHRFAALRPLAYVRAFCQVYVAAWRFHHPHESSQIIFHTITGYREPVLWPAHTSPELAILPSTWAVS